MLDYTDDRKSSSSDALQGAIYLLRRPLTQHYLSLLSPPHRGSTLHFPCLHAHPIKIKPKPDRHVFVSFQFMGSSGGEMTQPALSLLTLARSHGKDKSLVIVNLIFHSICYIISMSGHKSSFRATLPCGLAIIFYVSQAATCVTKDPLPKYCIM